MTRRTWRKKKSTSVGFPTTQSPIHVKTKIPLASRESLFAIIPSLKSQRRVEGSVMGSIFERGPKNFASTPQPTSLPCFPADLNLQPHIHFARYNGAPPHTQRPILKICQAILLSRHFSCKINLLLTCFRADTTCFHLLQVAQKYDIFSNCSQQQRGP